MPNPSRPTPDQLAEKDSRSVDELRNHLAAPADPLLAALHLLADEAYESGLEIGELIEERRRYTAANPQPAEENPA